MLTLHGVKLFVFLSTSLYKLHFSIYKECPTQNTDIGSDWMMEKVKLDVSKYEAAATLDTQSDGI